MPNYNFINTDTGEEFEEFFTISGREEFLKNNPNIKQTPSLFSMVGGTGDRIKNDDGWKENMSRIKENKRNLQTSHEMWVNCQIKDDVKRRKAT